MRVLVVVRGLLWRLRRLAAMWGGVDANCETCH